jgi:hypothetical protein
MARSVDLEIPGRARLLSPRVGGTVDANAVRGLSIDAGGSRGLNVDEVLSADPEEGVAPTAGRRLDFRTPDVRAGSAVLNSARGAEIDVPHPVQNPDPAFNSEPQLSQNVTGDSKREANMPEPAHHASAR